MKKPFTSLTTLLPLALAWGLSLPAWAQATYNAVPLTAASFTADIIANGAAAVSPVSSATADADGAGYYLMSQDYYTAATAHTSGLPTSGLIPNSIAGLSGLTYQLASYSANNSLRIGLAGGTGAVTFATPTATSEVYVLGISGSGATTVTMTVNYSDGTTTAFAAQAYPDWFTVSATQNVFGSSGRASVMQPVSATTAANTAPYLSQVKLTIPTAKTSTTITGISFTTAAASGVLNVLAVSARATPTCTPSTATFSYPAASYCTNGTTAPAATLATGATAGTFTASPATGLTLNATTGAITLNSSTAGTYTVTNTVAATATNCASTATATVTIAAAPATPTLTSSGTAATGITLTSSAATGNQFYLNGTAIAGATGTSYLVNSGTKNGSYTVVVTNAAGCSATSAAVNVTVTAATAAQASTALSVAPNPTRDGLLTLELSGFREAVSLTVTNTLGQRVAESTVLSTALGQKQTLNLSALPAGVYLLQARTASGTVEVRRIVRE